MFHGEFDYNLDDKNRVSVPADFREELGANFVAVKWYEKVIALFSVSEWQKFKQKLDSLPVTKSRTLNLFFSSGSANLEPDKQGRIVLPQKLREYANITKEVTFVASTNHAQIWDRAAWQKYNEDVLNYELMLKETEQLEI